MRVFLIKVIVFLSFFLMFLYLGNETINSKIRDNKYYIISDTINTIILGQSQSECSINDTLLHGTRNFSQSAEPYYYTYFKLKKLCNSNPHIKNVIIEFSNASFANHSEDWIFDDKYMIFKYVSYSHLLPLSENINLFIHNPAEYTMSFIEALKIKSRFKETEKGYDYFGWGGYKYLSESQIALGKNDHIISIPKDDKFSILNLNALIKIVEFCDNSNIRIIFLRSPLHPNFYRTHEITLLNFKNQFFSEIEFWDYADFNITDQEFADYTHLNYKGAKKFSIMINHQMNN